MCKTKTQQALKFINYLTQLSRFHLWHCFFERLLNTITMSSVLSHFIIPLDSCGNVKASCKHCTACRACTGCDSSCFHKSRKCENLTFYKLQIWVFFRIWFIHSWSSVKICYSILENQRDNEKTCILLVCLILSIVSTFHTILFYKKYTKDPRFERNWNKSRPYQK